MIELKDVTKTYRIPHEKRDTLFEILLGYIKNQNIYENLNALEDVTLSIAQGESIGIVGRNGSGKTTLLKVIAGIIDPTKGTVNVHGKIAPFITLGVGFHPDLTAKENIRLHGAIMGMMRNDLKRRTEKILRFAGVERFRDTKLKKFSTGMSARLAFSMMVESNPDILLLDEIFAVGDKDFQPKCTEILERYKKNKKTVLLTNHTLHRVSDYCEKTIVMDRGRIMRVGPTKKMIRYYEKDI